MTELNIDRLRDGEYVVHYAADKVEFTDVTEIFEVITDWYNRYSSINEDFYVGRVEFHGQFKGKGSELNDILKSCGSDPEKLLSGQ